ncbi:MAG: translation initiation factor IF-2 N-terminal domain-containing protein [Planctomycetota bacterium]|nr:translation initiation factor IF-2 N-terminal domain-containing protein [Planctomycetota bacterium]
MAPRKKKIDVEEIMVVNDSPGDECRIAILQDGHLEEIYAERLATATNVGNIYKGRVTNVESAIQAAFVDFGEAKNGFLHISDLHPQYFPGRERTERVGKKIPRRERPLIQKALKRGDVVEVQVLKEGIGTKGPTLSSYLSIPGRMMVMMPGMDRVGVSRKIEDEEKRREMRLILDSLNLPEGLGFILRTAGIGAPKTELKRDVSYLMRLWKVMEERIAKIGAPCELYTESDLLIRTIRDVVRPSITTIVVDSQSAYERISQFLNIVAPRSAPKVLHYTQPMPIFHAFNIERQIELIHCRSVPLPSGGQIVIDQTEALVAIDVNSGKSRSARDSETNAYQTNCEAADEICRQVRLRDLGGLVINDLIDMRATRHRKEIEDRFRENLKRDRAKTTILRLSQFGILEMTRQRMRPSLRSSHYVDCVHCDGHGEVKSPDFVGADATRQLDYLLQYDRIHRVELVCSPKVATVLLSTRRRELVRLEEQSHKKIDVRVSEAIATDRVDFNTYDDRNVLVDLEKLPEVEVPSIKKIEQQMVEAQAKAKDKSEAEPEPREGDEKKKRGRRRRRRKLAPADATTVALSGDFDEDWQEEKTKKTEGDADAPSEKGRRQGKTKTTRKPKKQERSEVVSEPVSKADTRTKIRIHELAKALDLTSKEIILRCKDSDIEVKNHMSSVKAHEADQIQSWFDELIAASASKASAPDTSGTTSETKSESKDDVSDSSDKPSSRRRRGKRGGRRRRKQSSGTEATPGTVESLNSDPEREQPAEKKTTRKRRRPQKKSTTTTEHEDKKPEPLVQAKDDSTESKSRKKRSRRKKTTARSNAEESSQDRTVKTKSKPKTATEVVSSNEKTTEVKPIRKRRSLYGRRVSVSPSAREAAEKSGD